MSSRADAASIRLQVCIGLNPIWRRISDPEAAGRLAEWTVQNESPGGFAIMRLTGVTDTLVSGMSIALRKDARQPWAICVIRWVRSETPSKSNWGCNSSRIGDSCADCIPHRARPQGRCGRWVLPPLRRCGATRRSLRRWAPTLHAVSCCCMRARGSTWRRAPAQSRHADHERRAFQFEVDPYPI